MGSECRRVGTAWCSREILPAGTGDRRGRAWAGAGWEEGRGWREMERSGGWELVPGCGEHEGQGLRAMVRFPACQGQGGFQRLHRLYWVAFPPLPQPEAGRGLSLIPGDYCIQDTRAGLPNVVWLGPASAGGRRVCPPPQSPSSSNSHWKLPSLSICLSYRVFRLELSSALPHSLIYQHVTFCCWDCPFPSSSAPSNLPTQ